MRKLTGGIDVTSNGRFRVRVRKQTVGIYDTEDEAETMRAATVDVLESEENPDLESVGSFGETVLTARQLGKKIRDADNDWNRWRTHVAGDRLSSINVRALKPAHIEAWLERLEEKALAPQTRRNCLNLLRVVLRSAVKKHVCRSNPAIGIRVEGRSEPRWTYLTPGEQEKLYAAVEEPLRHLVAFAVGTGMRAGEVAALRLTDLHLEGDDPHALVRFGKCPDLPTKNGRPRSVPLFGVGLAAARAWLAALPYYARSNPRGLAFPGRDGGFRSEAHVILWGSWRAAQDAVGRRFRWHDLRHTCASSLVSGWWGRRWSLEEVREMLGHSSISITQRYAHLAPSAVSRAARETRGVTEEPYVAQVRGMTGSSNEFLNRRSPVQSGPRAPHQNHSGFRSSAWDERDTALALLRAIAEGDGESAGALALELADRALDTPICRAALGVVRGGPLAVTCAVELAQLLLDAGLAVRSREGSR